MEKENTTTAQILEEVAKKPTVPIKGDSKSFLSKWAVDTSKPIELQDLSGPKEEFEEQQDGQEASRPAHNQEIAGSNPAPATTSEELPKKKVHGFAKRLEHEKEEALKKAQQLEEEKKNLQEVEIPSLTKKITELEEKLKNSKTQAEFDATEKKIEEAEKLRAQYEEIVQKNKELESKVEFYDLENSPAFQNKYVKPIVDLRRTANNILGANETHVSDFTKAMQASLAAMQATSDQERLRQENFRDELLSSILENLPPFKQARFTDVANKMIFAIEEHNSALQNQAETKRQLITKAQEEQEENARRQAKIWKDAYHQNFESYEEDSKFPEEIQKVIKSHKIDDSIEEDSDIAKSTIDLGMRRFSPEEITRVINQGRVYKRQKAYIKAQDIIIKELRETIETLKGSSLNGGSGAGSRQDPQNGGNGQNQGGGLKNHLSKFSPSAMGL